MSTTPLDLEDPLAATMSSTERTPLLSSSGTAPPPTASLQVDADAASPPTSFRESVFAFLEAKTGAGQVYESFMIGLIVLNVVSFVLSTLFVEAYNPEPWAMRHAGICGNACDAWFFGNYDDNGLQWLGIGSTSILELVTVAVFSIEYVLRLWTADLESDRFAGFKGRLLFVPTFFSMVDLASTLPFYLDAFVLTHTDIAASGFLRMFRLLRMMRVEGRYETALTMVDDVFEAQKGILFTALFVGVTTWMTVSALYYLSERRNLDMIYCPTCSGDDIDMNACLMDEWGMVTCQDCPATESEPRPCYNMYESIPMASYYALLNLFGEFPLIDAHSPTGQVVGSLTAIVAVAVFALPAGIIGNGFEDVIDKSRQRDESLIRRIVETGGMTNGFTATANSWRAWCYNLLHAQTLPGSTALDLFINLLIIATAFTFALDTTSTLPPHIHVIMDSFEFLSVCVFTLEYLVRVYCAKEDPKYKNPGGRLRYMFTFLPLVDVLSVLPYWLEVAWTGHIITPTTDTSIGSNLVKSLRLLRMLRFERYTHAFTTFDDVVSRNADILAVTAFTAVLIWVFFSAWLYFTERDSPDAEMAANYRTVPHAMWLTLLNLSGESPLSQYSAAGKVATGLLGLFATGIFGIPIGVLGAGFEEIVEEENEDNEEELEATLTSLDRGIPEGVGTSLEQTAFNFVNGIGSELARKFEMLIYILIFLTISVGVWQTVPGEENAYHQLEWIAVVIFTLEYLIRFVGAGADPIFAKEGRNGLTTRLHFIISFYSVIDLMAIVPFYVATAMPQSFLNEYDEYLRMLRILRLLKLDKYIPSITLIDDVIRLKANTLRVAGFAALTLWVLFAAAMFLCEHHDTGNAIDSVPLYGCSEDCNMSDRFQNFFDSLVYTGIHLTGDYPIITYSWPARFVNFFMVIAAVGIVSIPSGLIASGFVEIVQSKHKKKQGDPAVRAGDDWYEVRYRELEGVEPPPSRFGPTVDKWQVAVNDFLNGTQTEAGHHVHSNAGYVCRIFIFTVILANVGAVLAESMPSIDKYVGNEPGNFFDRFEFFSVMVFAIEYILRLFCAPKNQEALFSTFVYATTFFGIVDFLSTAPWFVEQGLILSGYMDAAGDNARIFRIFRIFRILQLEDFITAFSKLDNVFRASKDVLKATGLLALIIWVGCGALFYIFEENNPNWRECDSSVPLRAMSTDNAPGCFDFPSTAACNDYYPGLCSQRAFVDMPNALYYTAVFLGGEWGVVDFTWPGRMVCLFLCVMGIALYAIPIGTLFDSFGAVLGMGGDDDEEEEEEAEGDAPDEGKKED